MANVMFKRGTQAALNNLESFVDGAFYLTTDTDRLYVAQSSSELVELNKSITVVDNLSALPLHTSDTETAIKGSDVAVGQFYYVKAGAGSISGNILAVCSAIADGNITWTQVNPDTNDNNNDDTFIYSVGVSELTDADADYVQDKITYKITIQEHKTNLLTNTDYTAPAAKTATFTIDPADIAHVGIGSSAVDTSGTNPTITVSLEGAGSDSAATINLVAGDHVSFTGSTADSIKINAAGATYGIAAPADASATAVNSANIVLADGDGNTDTVALKAGTGLKIDDTGTDEITFYHVDNAATGSNGVGPAANVSSSILDANATGPITINVPNVKFDDQGHVTDDSANKSLSITPITAIGVGASDKSTLVLTDQAGGSVTSAAHTLSYSITRKAADGTGSAVTVDNQGDLGTFYTADAIDAILKNKFNNLNPLIYKGTVGSVSSTMLGNDLPTSNVSIGDVYLVDADVDISVDSNSEHDVAANIGDLFIAQAAENATEDANGHLAATDIVWTQVKSGKDIDTHYALSANNGSTNEATITLDNTTGNTTAGTATLKGDDNITIGYSDNKINIGHAHKFTATGAEDIIHGNANGTAIATTLTPAAGGTFNVPSFKLDKDGHVSSIADTVVTLPAETAWDIASPANSTTINLMAGTSIDSIVTLTQEAGGDVVVSGTTANEINIAHKSYSAINAPTDGTVLADTKAYGETITAITDVTTSNGHVTGLTAHTFTLPGAQTVSDTYTAVAASGTSLGGVQEVSALDSVTYSTKQYVSDTLNITNTVTSGVNKINFEIAWGTF